MNVYEGADDRDLDVWERAEARSRLSAGGFGIIRSQTKAGRKPQGLKVGCPMRDLNEILTEVRGKIAAACSRGILGTAPENRFRNFGDRPLKPFPKNH